MMNKINKLRTLGASENQLSGLKRAYQRKDGASFARELGNFGWGKVAKAVKEVKKTARAINDKLSGGRGRKSH